MGYAVDSNWNEIQTYHLYKELPIRPIALLFWWSISLTENWIQTISHSCNLAWKLVGLASSSNFFFENNDILYPICWLHYLQYSLSLFLQGFSSLFDPFFMPGIFLRHQSVFVPFKVFSRQIVYKNWSNQWTTRWMNGKRKY